MAQLGNRPVEKDEKAFIEKVEAKGYQVKDLHMGTAVMYFDGESCTRKTALKYLHFTGLVAQMADNLIDRN